MPFKQHERGKKRNIFKENVIQIKWNRPTDSVAGITISSGAGPGIMDGLQ